MRFFRFLPFVALAIATPAPVANSDAAIVQAAVEILKRDSSAAPLARASADMELASLIEARQLDLGSLTGLLSNLSASFAAIEQLLAPSTLNNIEAVVNDLASLFSSPTVSQTKGLISTVSDLLGSDSVKSLIDSLPTLLGSVTGLLTPALITNLTDILGGAHNLLTPAFVSETTGLISDVAPVCPSSLKVYFHVVWR
jgi:hypothetical protein